MSHQHSTPQEIPKDFPPVKSFLDQQVPGHLRETTGDSNSQSSWPYRLLHLKTWTSLIRQPGNIYGGIKEPFYNILSYTWGRWLIPHGTSIPIAGVDWPIPVVDPSHFTVDDFKSAIRMAGQGAEFVWIDIACIPQEHAGETNESVVIRGEEIGKQAKIFTQATDSFAWFCGLDRNSLFVDGRAPAFESLRIVLKSGQPTTPDAAAHHIDAFDRILTATEKCIDTFLAHPWLSSLWTLQECTLRPYSYILLKNGELLAEPGRPWTTYLLRDLVAALADMSLTEECARILRQVEAISIDQNMPEASRLGYTDSFVARVTEMAVAFQERGLIRLEANPNIVYSASQHRKVSKALDRIYGIVQIYDISCTSFPAGDDDEEKLGNLEDEFGSKLVAQSAVMSQLFIHTMDHRPRRTWLITPHCHVPPEIMDIKPRWAGESASLCDMTVQSGSGHLGFRGNGWDLAEFARHAFSAEMQPKGGFNVHKQGLLILDHHVSMSVGFERDHNHKGAEIIPAVQRMLAHYGSGNGTRDLKLLLIGGTRELPYWRRYIGLVILQQPPRDSSDERDDASDLQARWERLGIVKWFGSKHYDLVTGEPKKPLPEWEYLDGVIE